MGRMSKGRPLQTVGPVKEKDLSAKVSLVMVDYSLSEIVREGERG